jgi:phage shock protein A
VTKTEIDIIEQLTKVVTGLVEHNNRMIDASSKMSEAIDMMRVRIIQLEQRVKELELCSNSKQTQVVN